MLYASYIFKNDLYRYSIDTEVFFNNIIGYIPKLSRLENNKTPEIRKRINDNEISLKTSNSSNFQILYSSHYMKLQQMSML